MEKKKITVSNAQYNFLQDIRGVNEKAHYMIMTATMGDKKWVLEGDDDTFFELVSDLHDEIQLQPRSKSARLSRLIDYLEPDCDF
jgi:hypothetical protein